MPIGAKLASKSASSGVGESRSAAAGRARALADPSRPLLDVRGVTIQYKTQRHLVTATYRAVSTCCRPTASSCWDPPAAASRPC